MYSVVLAAMLTAGPAPAPAWGHSCHGCCGGYSCCGGYNAFSSSCCCGGYSCCGGGWHSSCCGGWSSCCGGYSCCCGGGWYPSYWSCCGGYSSCYGCCGGSSCCGGWYSGYGSYCSGGEGWYRSCCGGAWVSASGYAGVVVASQGAPASLANLPDPKQSVTAVPATVVIKAPMDVHITVNAQPIDRQSAEQTFTTSDLQPGLTYSYDVRAEAVRDGKTVTRTQTVIVKAGRESRADFGDLTTADGAAHVTISAPADARVTVDGVEVPGTSRTFSTPALEAGRTYYYTVTAEMTRDGRKVSDSRHVLVAAGQDVSVEFKETGVVTAGK